MRKVWMSISIFGLILLPAMSIMQLAGLGSAELGKCGLAIGTVLWFATAPLWVNGKTDNEK